MKQDANFREIICEQLTIVNKEDDVKITMASTKDGTIISMQDDDMCIDLAIGNNSANIVVTDRNQLPRVRICSDSSGNGRITVIDNNDTAIWSTAM